MLFPIALISMGVMGWIASFGLTLERLHVAENPDASASCDISPILSCKSVMLSEQAALLGFPNPLIGVAAFIAPILVGMAILAGAKFAPWFWRLFLIGHVFALGFTLWLFTQSAYVIGSLCIYCMVAWAATIPLFWMILGKTMKDGSLGKNEKLGDFIFSWSWVLTLMSYLILIVLMLIQFWDYWITLI
jgi:uncharacterized membrane protein|tara:strand:- start:797 stop:1363 length:567 start_codon:yes stop_codon:yes gene_type:complete